MKTTMIFIAFPVNKYERAELGKMNEKELKEYTLQQINDEEVKDDDLPVFYTPQEVAEMLNDECTFCDMWMYAVTIQEGEELYTIL